jgi:hypothetical protein
MTELPLDIQQQLQTGVAIPASPLALNEDRQLDERRQRALWRYYAAAGAGGVAIGVHTTQFAIRDPKVGLFEPLLELAQDELNRLDQGRTTRLIRVAGICGTTDQAVHEATMARQHGFQLGLLSLTAMKDHHLTEILEHSRRVGEILPLFGFYLQPDVGGLILPYEFWRDFCELPSLAAIKVAPFNRYRTIDVMRAVAESQRHDVAMYTGNDDNIVMDLVTPYHFRVNGQDVERRFVGGLLGHWAVWTRAAVQLLEECQKIAQPQGDIPSGIFQKNLEVTDMNAALFDVANNFAGCIPGVHEILRRQGLLAGTWCLDTEEQLSSGQSDELDRVCRNYPQWIDDSFIAEHRQEWLAD